MKPEEQIKSEVSGKLLIKKNRAATQMNVWLREKGISYKYNFYKWH